MAAVSIRSLHTSHLIASAHASCSRSLRCRRRRLGNTAEQANATTESLNVIKPMCSKQDVRTVAGKLVSDSVCSLARSHTMIHATTALSGDVVPHAAEHN